MILNEAIQKFIHTWGDLGVAWGVPRSMTQIHALLLISPNPLDVQHIIKTLNISMGNANTNLRKLLDWQLIYKKKLTNKRKDYFLAEKDMWTIFVRVLTKRKEKELQPMINTIDELLELKANCTASKEFCRVIRSIKQFSNIAGSATENLIQADSDFVLRTWSELVQ